MKAAYPLHTDRLFAPWQRRQRRDLTVVAVPFEYVRITNSLPQSVESEVPPNFCTRMRIVKPPYPIVRRQSDRYWSDKLLWYEWSIRLDCDIFCDLHCVPCCAFKQIIGYDPQIQSACMTQIAAQTSNEHFRFASCIRRKRIMLACRIVDEHNARSILQAAS